MSTTYHPEHLGQDSALYTHFEILLFYDTEGIPLSAQHPEVLLLDEISIALEPIDPEAHYVTRTLELPDPIMVDIQPDTVTIDKVLTIPNPGDTDVLNEKIFDYYLSTKKSAPSN